MQRSRVIGIFVGLVLAAFATVLLKNVTPPASPADAGMAGGVASSNGPERPPAPPPSYLAVAADGTAQRVAVPDVDPTAEDIPVAALAAYQRAADIMTAIKPECGLDWPLLAAVARVESDHGREAADPFRIRPETWNVVGVDGDGDGVRSPEDVDDAALAVAVYLCSGSEDLRHEEGARAALARYDASPAWAALVLGYADLYRNGDFGTWRDGGSVVVTAVLTGPRLSATSLGRSALDLAEKRAALPARVMATVRADARDAVEAAEEAEDPGAAARTGGDGLTTQVDAPVLVAPEPSKEEVRSFVLGTPVGEDPAVAEQREATVPSGSPTPASAPVSSTSPSGSASSAPAPDGPASSDPDPTSGSSESPAGSESTGPSAEPEPSASAEPEPSVSAEPEPSVSAEPSGDPSEPANAEESPAPSPTCDPTADDPTADDPAAEDPAAVDLSLLPDDPEPCE